MTMRLSLPVLIATLASGVLPERAGAAEYPWCAQHAMQGDICRFVSYEQCRMAVTAGGICQPNPFYPGAKTKPATKRRSNG